MKKLLIIRSVSFQQLDLNIIEIKNKFPNHEIYLLTHEHGVTFAKKYKDIDNIVIYPYKQPFKFGNKVDHLKNIIFDTIIVPVNNITGLGFFNVFLYSLAIKGRKRYLCNLVSEMKEISTFNILSMGLKNLLFSLISFGLTLISGLFLIILFPFKLLQLQEK